VVAALDQAIELRKRAGERLAKLTTGARERTDIVNGDQTENWFSATTKPKSRKAECVPAP
jgi:hypothetical protein